MSSRRLPLMLVGLILWGAPAALSHAADTGDVFGAFLSHIERQIRADKQGFVDAQACTEWFYKRPRQPQPSGVSYRVLDLADCPLRYPNLEAAREDFSRTQSLLSISLTFYEFALVGDRNDDRRYSTVELRDILTSFDLPFDQHGSARAHTVALTSTFDLLRQGGKLDALMASMGRLYDQGYRLTPEDKASLESISR